MTTALTLADVKRLAHEAADEMGVDTTYTKRDENGFPLPEGMDPTDDDSCDEYGIDPKCMYVHKDYAEDGSVVMTPGCLVGRILVKAGVPLGWFDEHEGSMAGVVLRAAMTDGLVNMVDPIIADYLMTIQGQQDEGTPIGKAVEIGDDRY